MDSPLIVTASDQRLDFIEFVLRQEGKPYLWGGKGFPDPERAPGFDCSGLVTAAICSATKGKMDWRLMWNCNRLFSQLKDVERPVPGDLAFYGPGKNMLTHVMIWIGDGRVYGASGGDSSTTTIEKAQEKGARVRFRGIAHNQRKCADCGAGGVCAKRYDGAKYRPDFRGFKALPF